MPMPASSFSTRCHHGCTGLGSMNSTEWLISTVNAATNRRPVSAGMGGCKFGPYGCTRLYEADQANVVRIPGHQQGQFDIFCAGLLTSDIATFIQLGACRT